jgi:hypothetical protein
MDRQLLLPVLHHWPVTAMDRTHLFTDQPMKADLSFLQAIILALFRNQIRPSDAQPVNL